MSDLKSCLSETRFSGWGKRISFFKISIWSFLQVRLPGRRRYYRIWFKGFIIQMKRTPSQSGHLCRWAGGGRGTPWEMSRDFASEELLLLAVHPAGSSRSGAFTHPVERAVLQAVDIELSTLCESCLQGDQILLHQPAAVTPATGPRPGAGYMPSLPMPP